MPVARCLDMFFFSFMPMKDARRSFTYNQPVYATIRALFDAMHDEARIRDPRILP